MPKTKIDADIIVFFVVTVLLGLICFAIAKAMHAPAVPAAISLPIGEKNRTETLHLQGTRYGISSDTYIIRYDVTLQNLSRSAWCDSGGYRDGRLFLDCTWATPGQPVGFASAEIEVPVPAPEGLVRWEFNRELLQAVPVMQSWFVFNFWYFCFLLFFGTICFLCGLLFINACLEQRDRIKENERLAQA